MNVKIKGVITRILDTTVLDNGAKSLTYIVDTKEQYNNIFAIQLYKKSEDLQHFDNFLKFNKVGSKVEVEFTIRSNERNGKYWTSLNHWKITSLDTKQPQPQKPETFASDDDGLDWLTGE